MKVRITLTEEMLGTACANPDVERPGGGEGVSGFATRPEGRVPGFAS